MGAESSAINARVVLSENMIIAPGFFDNQVNGFAGISFSFGGGQLSKDGIEKATNELWEKGVTTYLPTLTTNDQKLLVKNPRQFGKGFKKPAKFKYNGLLMKKSYFVMPICKPKKFVNIAK